MLPLKDEIKLIVVKAMADDELASRIADVVYWRVLNFGLNARFLGDAVYGLLAHQIIMEGAETETFVGQMEMVKDLNEIASMLGCLPGRPMGEFIKKRVAELLNGAPK